VQQHLQRLDGVAKAEVSLRDGKVAVLPKQGGVLDPQAILKATYDSGVSVAEMDITASGTPQASGNGTVFKISEKLFYAITPATRAQELRPRTEWDLATVRVRGRLYRKPPGASNQKDPPTLSNIEILEVLGGVR
jgi:hypothetical protein